MHNTGASPDQIAQNECFMTGGNQFGARGRGYGSGGMRLASGQLPADGGCVAAAIKKKTQKVFFFFSSPPVKLNGHIEK